MSAASTVTHAWPGRTAALGINHRGLSRHAHGQIGTRHNSGQKICIGAAALGTKRLPLRRKFGKCFSGSNDNNDSPDNDGEEDTSSPLSLLVQSFTSPRIDDAGLPLADSLICGAIAPLSTAYFFLATGLPRPLWLVVPASTPTALRGLPYLWPAFSHGTILASCWLVGALAGRAFEEPRYKGEGVLLATLQSGSFAVGLLILVNQLTLAVKLGTIPALAELNPDQELLVAQTIAALALDIITEAFFMLSWRLYRGNLP